MSYYNQPEIYVKLKAEYQKQCTKIAVDEKDFAYPEQAENNAAFPRRSKGDEDSQRLVCLSDGVVSTCAIESAHA